MATNGHVFDHAVHTADEWLLSVAREFGTDDRGFVHRALRAWLHGLRDELTVDACSHFAAQLPELLRGIYYEGWDPSQVPVDHDLNAYVARFAREAHVRPTEVRHVASTVTAGLRRHLSASQLTIAFEQLPPRLRGLLSIPPHVAEEERAEHRVDRVARLEDQVMALRDAVSELVRGLEPIPTREGAGQEAAQAVRRAHQILLSAPH